MTRRLLILCASVAALTTAVAAAAVGVLTPVSQDADTITFSFDRIDGAGGYRFYLDGQAVSRRFDPANTTVRFRKGSTYGVAPLTITEGPQIVYPAPAPPPPPPPPGNVVQLSGTVSSAQVNSAPSGSIVRGPFTVNGPLTISRGGITVDRATVNGHVQFDGSANGSAFVNGSAQALRVYADDVLVQGNVFDNGGRVPNPQSDAVGATNLRVIGNTFRNFYGRDPATHSEALYWGAGSSGLIEGNVFTNNGNTGHVFFTWWPTFGDWPRNVCVRGNTFGPTAGAYFAIDSRTEIPASANIRIDPSQQSTKALSAGNRFLASC